MDYLGGIDQLSGKLQSTNLRAAPPAYSENDDDGKRFHAFSDLPLEIRLNIWELALEPRVVRRKRKESRIIFTASSGWIPLLSVCHESRMAAFLYGKYRTLTPNSRTYFSPVLDYLWFDPGWGDGDFAAETKMSLAGLECVRNLMIHPNFSEMPKRPILGFAHLAKVNRVLIAADEKSLVFNTKIMLNTVEDVRRHYQANSSSHPRAEFPYIAIGCLGWVGIQRILLRHGTEDRRQLVAIFENGAEMKAHWARLRGEERKLREQNLERPSVYHQLRRLQGKEYKEQPPLQVSKTFPFISTVTETRHEDPVCSIAVRRQSLTIKKPWWKGLLKQKA